MTLVSKRLRGKQLFEVSSNGGQCLAVNIGPLLALNSYAAHHEHRSDFLARVFDFCRQRSNYWVLTGDSHRLSLAFHTCCGNRQSVEQ